MAEEKVLRTYVSPKLKVEGWDDIAHHFEELLYRKIGSEEELRNPAIVKIAMSESSEGTYRAHYFSRAPIPHGH